MITKLNRGGWNLSLPGTRSVWLLGVALLASGCNGGLAQNFQPPGTIWQQRNRAVQFDPYPIDHMGPAIVGGRPREYAKPLAEARDSQLVPRSSNRGW